MANCCGHINDGGRLFSRFARLSRCCYNLRGLGKSQQFFVNSLNRLGIANTQLIEIGCGVGALHQTLLLQGAGFAVGVDLADNMLKQAQIAADKNHLSACTRYMQGDFVQIVDSIEPADIMLMDKVVCCYPDADSLLKTALSRTRRILAITYPRNKWWVRAAVAVEAFFLKLSGSSFRSYVHSPLLISHIIQCEGYVLESEYQDSAWISQIWLK